MIAEKEECGRELEMRGRVCERGGGGERNERKWYMKKRAKEWGRGQDDRCIDTKQKLLVCKAAPF